MEESFRLATEPFASQTASKGGCGCRLLAFAQASHSRLITFDRALYGFAYNLGSAAVRAERGLGLASRTLLIGTIYQIG